MIKVILYGAAAIVCLIGLYYILSRVQMRGWLHEADKYFNNLLLTEYSKFKNKTDEGEKK
jgi:hypothetical protein